MTLNGRTRQRGLTALLVFTFFMVTGFTLVMPLIAVHFVNRLGWAAGIVGLALGVRQLTQQGLAVVAGTLTDRFGARGLLCGGVLLRALGFGSLAWVAGPTGLFIALIISALGGVLFEVPYQASIAILTTAENRPRYYALSNFVGGVATTIGPLLGIWLLRFDFAIVCWSAAGCFIATFIIAFFVLPPINPAREARPMGEGFKDIANDRPFLLLTGLLMGYWFIAVQINISLPILAERLTGTPESVGVIFSVNAAITVCLQYPLIRFLERFFSPRAILMGGITIIAFALGAIAWATSLTHLIICGGVFSLGAVLTRPTQQTLNAAFARPQSLGTYLGVSSLALAIGGGIGNSIGGWLMEIAAQPQHNALPWLIFLIVGICSAAGLMLLRIPSPEIE